MTTRRFRAPRWLVSMQCGFTWDDPQFEARPQEGLLAELSAEGAFVISESIPEAGTKLVFTFQTEKNPEEFEFLARVIHSGWYKLPDRDEPVQGFGVHFTSSSGETSRRLRRLLEEDISQNSKFAREKIRMRSRRLPSEAELQQRALRYKTFFEEFTQPMYMADRDGRLLHFNQAAQALLGYHLNEALELSDKDLFTASSLKRLKGSLKTARPEELEVQMLRSDGIPVECLLFAAPRQAGDGSPLGYNAMAVDRRRSNQKRPLVERAVHLSQAGLMARHVAAEINESLSTVLGAGEAALKALRQEGRQQAEERIRQALASVHAGMDLAARLHLTCGDLSLRLQYVEDPRRLFQGVLEEVERELPSGYELEIVLEGRGSIRTDSSLLLRALQAVIDNACQAMPEGGVVQLASRDVRLEEERLGNALIIPAGRYLLLSVADEGGPFGLRPTGDALLPFKTSRPSALGLGLTAVWGVMSCHGGFLDIHGGHDGCRVDLYFPLRKH
ncbi:MAG TPA: PAS domain-containing protein [Acidobacteriota bacterium]|nr:PAS domain-containing protein [Acidobacteriota bacterium]